MSKNATAKIEPISDGGSDAEGRSEVRQRLADAIRARDEADREDGALARARQRASQDLFAQRRLVEAAESVLAEAKERDARELVATYVSGEPNAEPSGVPEAEAALRRAREKLAEIEAISADLAGRGRAPGFSVPNAEVERAIRDIVRNCPTIRRLVEDYRTAAPLASTSSQFLAGLSRCFLAEPLALTAAAIGRKLGLTRDSVASRPLITLAKYRVLVCVRLLRPTIARLIRAAEGAIFELGNGR